jgi:hypothetical protein
MFFLPFFVHYILWICSLECSVDLNFYHFILWVFEVGCVEAQEFNREVGSNFVLIYIIVIGNLVNTKLLSLLFILN